VKIILLANRNIPFPGLRGTKLQPMLHFVANSSTTLYQWEKAARIGIPSLYRNAMPWDLEGEERPSAPTSPVKAQCQWTASNSASAFTGVTTWRATSPKWCLNAKGDDFFIARGSWRDPPLLVRRLWHISGLLQLQQDWIFAVF
jgi:hypothetical protein